MTLPVQTAVWPYRALGKLPKIPLSHVSSAAHATPFTDDPAAGTGRGARSVATVGIASL
jgi:hypothetical protein